jgi:serine/threonine-protein kinase
MQPGCVEPRTLGRYALYDEIAAGGMATVHLGTLVGAAGVRKVVAIKRLHPHIAKDRDVATMFLDEARLSSRVRHPNLVGLVELVQDEGELFLVMDYVPGESLARITRSLGPGERVAPEIAAGIVVGVLQGLHAAHSAKDEHGQLLGIVHRDVSPQNILLGEDGVARLLDFGVAKAAGRLQTTREGQIKGKLAYMAPEQISDGKSVDARADVYAAAVVLWELFTGERLFDGDSDGMVLAQVLSGLVDPPSRFVADLPPAVDAIVLRGIERNPGDRFASALDMAIALENALLVAPARTIAAWVTTVAAGALGERAALVGAIERHSARAASALPSRVERGLESTPVPPGDRDERRGTRLRGRHVGIAIALLSLTGLAAFGGSRLLAARGDAAAEVPIATAASEAPPASTPVTASAPRNEAAPGSNAPQAPPSAAKAASRPASRPAPASSHSRPLPAPKARGPECLYKDASGITRVRPECLR